RNGVGKPRLSDTDTKSGSPDSETRAHSGRNDSSCIGFADSFDRPAHSVNPTLLQGRDAATDIVRQDFTVTIDAQDDLAYGEANRCIESGGDNSFGVINNRDVRALPSHLGNDFAGIVG